MRYKDLTDTSTSQGDANCTSTLVAEVGIDGHEGRWGYQAQSETHKEAIADYKMPAFCGQGAEYQADANHKATTGSYISWLKALDCRSNK